MALSKKYRLPLRFERNRINKEGRPFSGRYLTVIVSPSKDLDYPRFAILVSKKVSLLATDRNLLRRRVSEAINSSILLLKNNDYLVIPKKSSLGSSPEDLKKDILSILNVKSAN